MIYFYYYFIFISETKKSKRKSDKCRMVNTGIQVGQSLNDGGPDLNQEESSSPSTKVSAGVQTGQSLLIRDCQTSCDTFTQPFVPSRMVDGETQRFTINSDHSTDTSAGKL